LELCPAGAGAGWPRAGAGARGARSEARARPGGRPARTLTTTTAGTVVLR
jgi:hypothetical protein